MVKAMKQKTMRLITCLALTVTVISCGGPSIGIITEFQEANFQINNTTKNDVIDRLGLPQRIMKDSDGREHYIYEGTTRLVGACIGCGTPGPVGLIPALINETDVKNGAEYVFDTTNLLVAKFEPTKK